MSHHALTELGFMPEEYILCPHLSSEKESMKRDRILEIDVRRKASIFLILKVQWPGE